MQLIRADALLIEGAVRHAQQAQEQLRTLKPSPVRTQAALALLAEAQAILETELKQEGR